MVIDLGKIFNRARTGVLRAKNFCAVVLNPENSIQIKNLEIDSNENLLPCFEGDGAFYEEFKIFIIHSGLMEMMNLFDESLTSLYKALYYVKENKHGDIDKKVKKFDCSNFEKKLNLLNGLLDNRLKQTDFWKNLKDLRNCITHHASYVHTDELTIDIPYFRFFFKNEDGEEDFTPGEIHNKKLEKETEVCLQRIQKKKSFKKHERILFSDRDLNYLFFGMYQSIEDLFAIVLSDSTVLSHLSADERDSILKNDRVLKELNSLK